ncbi:MAG TPA: GNAT family N-acetyltransferase, partial [Thermoanaerobaculia bacterium]|nr:GNAT family N-acetyltransferase [Thermoanaerobaculia bacterium]
CELRKMYFRPEARGRGLGQLMLERCLTAARELGFRTCYLETLQSMGAARRMYEKNGFRQLAKRRGKTGHDTCDAFYERKL